MRSDPVIGGPDHDRLSEFLERHSRLFVLTGAGCSTESGIPDYRDADGGWKRSAPVMLQAFMGDAAIRQRYWARSLAGWRRFARRAAQRRHIARAGRLQQQQRVESRPAGDAERRSAAPAGRQHERYRPARQDRPGALHELPGATAARTAAGRAARAQPGVRPAGCAGGARRRCGSGRAGFLRLPGAGLLAVRRDPETGRGVLRRERSAPAGADLDVPPDAGRRRAGGRLLIDGVFRLPFRAGGGLARQADRRRESRQHASGCAAAVQGDAALLVGAGLPVANRQGNAAAASDQLAQQWRRSAAELSGRQLGTRRSPGPCACALPNWSRSAARCRSGSGNETGPAPGCARICRPARSPRRVPAAVDWP